VCSGIITIVITAGMAISVVLLLLKLAMWVFA
jgi:hypothetical protein